MFANTYIMMPKNPVQEDFETVVSKHKLQSHRTMNHSRENVKLQ